jgi:hypothetical protein
MKGTPAASLLLVGLVPLLGQAELPEARSVPTCIDFEQYAPDKFELELGGSVAAGPVRSGSHLILIVDSTLEIIDVADPQTPQVVGSVDILPYASHVEHLAAVDGYAFAINDARDILLFDVTDVSSPFVASTIDPPGSARDFAVSGNHVFVADFGFAVYDWSDPSAPVLVDEVATSGYSHSVAAWGTRAFVLSFLEGEPLDYDDDASYLDVVDVSSSGHATITRTLQAHFMPFSQGGPNSFQHVGVYGGLLWLREDLFGPYVYDASSMTLLGVTESTPVIVESLGGLGDLLGIDVREDRVYAAAYDRQFSIVDASAPSSPVLLGSTELFGFPEDVIVQGDFAYVAANTGRLQIVDIRDETAPVVVASMTVPHLKIYDTAGRLVRDLSRDELQPGAHSLRTPDGVQSRRAVLLK